MSQKRQMKGELGRMHKVPDEDLMRRYADGDGKAFEELFSRYEARAYGFFYKRTKSEDRAQDLYQELFLRLHRNRTSYDPSRPFAPWFFQIASRLLVDDYRRAFRNREVPVGEQERPSHERDSERRLGDLEEADRLLAELSPEERHILVSAKVEGTGYAELARDLGKSVDAVKKLASRAMQRLRGSTRSDAAPVEGGAAGLGVGVCRP
jgi:RNA polymerase sigma-70 factor (ECF subfamily)